jgi:hypothetical protein
MAESEHMVGDPARPSRIVVDPQVIDNPILDFFLSYWRSKRGAQALPLRNGFLPQEVRGHLPWVVVADALPDYTDFRYRVVGTHVCRYFLGDGTGKTVREAFGEVSAELAEGTLWLYRHACSERIPVRFTGPSSRWQEIYFPDFDAAYFPYSSDGKAADRVVNIFTFNYQKFLETRSTRVLAGAV